MTEREERRTDGGACMRPSYPHRSTVGSSEYRPSCYPPTVPRGTPHLGSFVALALALGACAHPCPSLAPPATAAAVVPHPSEHVGRDSATLTVRLRDAHDASPRARVPVRLECACLPAPLRLATGPHGLARAVGLPPGDYTIHITAAPALELRSAVSLSRAARFILNRALPPDPRPVRRDASALPPPIALLRYEQTACLGDCPAFVATLDDARHVRLEQDGHAVTWTLGPIAHRRSLRLARCLARAPSYDAHLRTDFPWVHLEVRDGEEVAVLRHDRGDPRAPQALTKLETALVRALRIPRHLERPPRSRR